MIAERGLYGVIAKVAARCLRARPPQRGVVKVKCTLEQEFVIGGFTAHQATHAFRRMAIG